MDDLAPTRDAIQCACFQSGVGIDLLVEPVEMAIRPAGPDVVRHGLGEGAELGLAFPQRQLSLFAPSQILEDDRDLVAAGRFDPESRQASAIVSLNKIPEIIQEVKSKRIDAAIIEDTVATGFKAGNDDIEFNVLPVVAESGAAIAFPKGSTNVADFNRVVKQMKDSGEIDRLATKWFTEVKK